VEKRNASKVLMVKPEGTVQLEIYRCEWEDTIKMDIRKIGWCGMD
jgi:hypothetical protein